MAGRWVLKVEVMSLSNLLTDSPSRVNLSLDHQVKATSPTRVGINPAFNFQYEAFLEADDPVLLSFQVQQQGGVLGSWNQVCSTRLGLEPELYLTRQILPLNTSHKHQSCGTIMVVAVQTAPVNYGSGASAHFEVPLASAPPESVAGDDIAGAGVDHEAPRSGAQGPNLAPTASVNFTSAAGQGYPLRSLVRQGGLPAELAGGTHLQNFGWLRVGLSDSTGDYGPDELWADTCQGGVRRAAADVLQLLQSLWQELGAQRLQIRRAAGGAIAGSSVEETMAGLQVLRIFLGHLSRGTLPQGPTMALALKSHQGELDLHTASKVWWVRVPSAGVPESWAQFDFDAAYLELLNAIQQELMDLGHELPAATGGPRPSPAMLFNPELGYVAKNEETLAEFIGEPFKFEVADAILSMSLGNFKKDVQWQIMERPVLTSNLLLMGAETCSYFVEQRGNFFWRVQLGPHSCESTVA
jgi:hypothetical protein